MLIPIAIAIAVLGTCYMLYHADEAWQIYRQNQRTVASSRSGGILDLMEKHGDDKPDDEVLADSAASEMPSVVPQSALSQDGPKPDIIPSTELPKPDVKLPSPVADLPDSLAGKSLKESVQQTAEEVTTSVTSVPLEKAQALKDDIDGALEEPRQLVDSLVAGNLRGEAGGEAIFADEGESAAIKPAEPDAPYVPPYRSQSLFSQWKGTTPDEFEGEKIRGEELPIPEEDMAYGSLTPSLAQLLPESQRRRDIQEQNLVAAGDRSRAAWINLNARRFLWAFGALILVGIGLIWAPESWEPYLVVMAVLGPLLAWGLPPLFVSGRAAYRKADIERGIPDVLDMLHMGVSQGLTVPRSLQRIAPEIKSAHPALSDELTVVNRQAEVGSLPNALMAFSKRIESPEVSSFTSLLLQSESTGSSIVRSLTDYSDSMRNTLKERADSKANSASFWMLFPIVCLMLSVFLFLLSPAVIQLTDFFDNTAGDVLNTRADALQSLQQQPVVVPLDEMP